MLFTRLVAATLALAASFQAAGIQRRQDVGDVIGSAAESIIHQVTSGAESIDEVTSAVGGGAGEVLDDVTSAVGEGWHAATRFGDNVFEHVTSFCGEAWTVVSSVGGEAVTIAKDGAGVVTSIGGEAVPICTPAFPEATPEAGEQIDNINDDDDESAAGGLTPSALVGIATTLGFSVLGAYITL
ncbi:hypothetical protein BDV98DRAFT_577661 [Pterulicium gracile]|uniref:Uncharacterized protein n=1 Tax=Pterulicium gracile TaxID=1884261 RepID=A0A5C3Q2V0_9AGAR|nr:hypothetical protein BDV98DRAFT_577661 [Pterula gracilis]